MLRQTCICDSCKREDTREGDSTGMAILSPGYHLIRVSLAASSVITQNVILCSYCLERHGLDREQVDVKTIDVKERLFDVVSEILLEAHREVE